MVKKKEIKGRFRVVQPSSKFAGQQAKLIALFLVGSWKGGRGKKGAKKQSKGIRLATHQQLLVANILTAAESCIRKRKTCNGRGRGIRTKEIV